MLLLRRSSVIIRVNGASDENRTRLLEAINAMVNVSRKLSRSIVGAISGLYAVVSILVRPTINGAI